jgi:Mrp family chromosome partitioning ATPase
MTALDQAFIKAYLQQAGVAHSGRKPSEDPEMPSPPPKTGLSGEEDAPLSQTLSQSEVLSPGQAGQRVLRSAGQAGQKERLSAGQAGPPVSAPPGGNPPQLGKISSPKPDSPDSSLQESEDAFRKASGHPAETSLPGRSRKKGLPRPGPLSLGEVLDQKDRQSSVGLPNRRTVEKLAAGEATPGHPVLRGPHFLSKRPRKSARPGSPILPFSQQSKEPSLHTPSETAPEVPQGEHPECILEFPGACPQPTETSSEGEVNSGRPKLSKNPRKITLHDLEIPREVCFFEPPSPTIPLEVGPQTTKIRGVPELPRPLERPRLSLFVPRSSPGTSSRQQECPARQSPEPPGGTTGLPLTPGVKAPQEKTGTDPWLRLRAGPEAEQTSEGGQDKRGKASARPTAPRPPAPGVFAASGWPAGAGSATLGAFQRPGPSSVPATLSAGSNLAASAGSADSGSFPSEADSATTRSRAARMGFSAHWHVPGFCWPKVCLALEAKAAGALDRVAEAILRAAGEGKKVLGFVSVRSGEGATTLLLCAARRLAERGGRVVVAETNLTHPDLADRLNVAPQVGWEQLGHRCRTVQEVLIESQADGVTLLPWCGVVRSGSEEVGRVGAALADALRELRQVYDVLLLDLGALEKLEETSVGEQRAGAVGNLLGYVEGLVVVRNVRTGVHPVDMGALRQRLQAAGVPIVGVVDNCV